MDGKACPAIGPAVKMAKAKDTITWVSEVVLFMLQRYLLANLHAISAHKKREASGLPFSIRNVRLLASDHESLS